MAARSEEIDRLVRWLDEMFEADHGRKATTGEARERIVAAAKRAHERWRDDPTQPAMIHVVFDDGEEIAEAIPADELTQIFSGKIDDTDEVVDRTMKRETRALPWILMLSIAGPVAALAFAYKTGVLDNEKKDDKHALHQSEAPAPSIPQPLKELPIASCTCVAKGEEPDTTFILHAPATADGRWYFRWSRRQEHYTETSTFWIAPPAGASLGIACHGDTVVLVDGDVATAWAREHYDADVPRTWTKTLPKSPALPAPFVDAGSVSCTPLAETAGVATIPLASGKPMKVSLLDGNVL